MSQLIQLSSSLRDQNKSHIVEKLQHINEFLEKNSHYTDKELSELAGPRGSLIQVLEMDPNNEAQLMASKCLHQLTYFSTEQLTRSRTSIKDILPPEVIASIQRIAIAVLKRDLSSSETNILLESQLISSCMSILYNLIISVPDQVLGNVILKACHPYFCYGVSWYKRPSATDWPEQPFDTSSMSESDSDLNRVPNYTNRNRQKRLRRKRAQPSCSTFEPVLSTSTRNFVPARILSSPQSLDTVSLKPQWARTSTNINESNSKSIASPTGVNTTSLFSQSNNFCRSNVVKTVPCLPSQSNLPGAGFMTRRGLHEEAEQLSSAKSKVRKSALVTINAVIEKAGRQNKFSFWPQLMCQNPSLMTCVLKDPSPSVRMAALQVINTFLIDSQQVLSMAVDDNPGGSYTTLGTQLGTSIRELHRCLILSLLSEKVCLSLVRILKTLELLMENVKYENLKPGLLTKTVTHVKYFLKFKEALVRANAFSFMVSFLMIKPQLPELKDILTKYQSPAPKSLTQPPVVRPPSPCEEQMPDDEIQDLLNNQLEKLNFNSEGSLSSDSEVEGSTKATTVSWIIQRCVDSLLFKSDYPVQRIYVQVQLQSLKVLSVLVSEHLSLINNSLPIIQHIITVCCDSNSAPVLKLEDTNEFSFSDHMKYGFPEYHEKMNAELTSSDPDGVVEHSFLLLGSLLGSVKSQLENDRKMTASSEPNVEICITPEIAFDLWLWALQHPLKSLLQRSDSSTESKGPEDAKNASRIKSLIASANVLSHLCSCVLDSIGDSMLTQVFKTVDYLLHNVESSLQLCGIRVMAIIVAYPALQEHIYGPKLVLRTIIISTNLLSLQCTLVNKDRLLASWALANVFSLIAPYKEMAQRINMDDFLTKEVMMTTLRSAMTGCKDKDKIRPHSVRCVGNAVASLSPSMLNDPQMKNLVDEAIVSLIECNATGNNMKMRWNACQALGHTLSSENIDLSAAKWRVPLLKSLCLLVENFRNYKVRIQACAALACPKERRVYGDEFFLVWRSLLKGLEDSQNVLDCQNIQHRDDLTNQLCVTLCHLIALLDVSDVGRLPDSLSYIQDTTKSLLQKAHNSLPPERVSCILRAAQRLKELLNSDALTSSQENNLNLLEAIFQVVE